MQTKFEQIRKQNFTVMARGQQKQKLIHKGYSETQHQNKTA